MLYVVEIRRERDNLADAMSGIRQWLDAQRFDPQSFRCTTDDESLTMRVGVQFGNGGGRLRQCLRGSGKFERRHVSRLTSELPLEDFGEATIVLKFDPHQNASTHPRDFKPSWDLIVLIEPEV